METTLEEKILLCLMGVLLYLKPHFKVSQSVYI